MSAPTRLLPVVDDESRPFFEAAARGELWVPRCTATGRFVFPPRAMSPFAPGAALAWEPVSGRGSVWSFVVAHPPLLPWFEARAPYPVVVVALDEDPRLRLVGGFDGDRARLRIGARVRVRFEPIEGGLALPGWSLEE